MSGPENAEPTGATAPPLPLLPQHLALVDGSAISREVAVERGYRSVTVKADLKRLGFSSAQQLVPSLLIPVRGVTGEIATYQLRPDQPRLSSRSGKPLKYETLAGSRMSLDVPVRARANLTNPSIPLFVTEGARKADAAASKGLTCVALLGVWNWRGTNSDGGKAALPDWESVALNEREVFVAFDSDVMTKVGVHQALARLKPFLESRKAKVRLVYLPPGPDASKTGLDDFFARGGTVEQLLSLATDKLREPPQDESASEPPYEETSTGLVWNRREGEQICRVQLTNFNARIERDVLEDDGVERRRVFEIVATLSGEQRRITVGADEFAGMSWPMKHLGATAMVQPGLGLRDHARAAIQSLSGVVREERVYAHLGWVERGGAWGFVHANGVIGSEAWATGATWATTQEEARLVATGDALTRFAFPKPTVTEAIERSEIASFKLLDVVSEKIAFALLSACFRAPLGATDFNVFLAGPSGVFKSELAALAQQHFGATMNARNLPGSWSSTANALEELAFRAKDVLVVVDDFAPAGTMGDRQRLQLVAERLLRGAGNGAGRGRMRADGTLRASRPPRCLILATGEDVPSGHSLRARTLVVPVGPGDVDVKALSGLQSDAAEGRFASLMASYLAWLAPRIQDVRAQLQTNAARLRDTWAAESMHRRTPALAANLAIGLQVFLDFAVDVRLLTPEQSTSIWERGVRALQELAEEQSLHQGGQAPAQRFMELVGSAVAAGRAHLAGLDGRFPGETPARFGWRLDGSDWKPGGDRIGWVDGEDVFLEPTVVHTAVQRFAPDGEGLAVTKETLARRLNEAGLLASTETRGSQRRFTVRRMAQGSRRALLHMRTEVLFPGQAQVAQPDASDVAKDGSAWATDSHSRGPVAQREARAEEQQLTFEGLGPLGPPGPVREDGVRGPAERASP